MNRDNWGYAGVDYAGNRKPHPAVALQREAEAA